jgi:hypothetical protein
MHDARLANLGRFTPEGILTPGYGDHYLFMVGRDDCHSILHTLIPAETMALKLNMFGYDDDELNTDILNLMGNPNVRVQGTLDRSQAGGVHERKIIESNLASRPDFYNSFVVGQSATHQISHTKGGVLVGLGIGFEGSMNWSNSGEGTGINLHPDEHQGPGFKAQNNTLLVSTNPVFLARFSARLDSEHITGMQQATARALAAAALVTV